MNKLNVTLEQVLGIVRHVLTIVGTVLVVSGSSLDQNNWSIISGSILGIVSLIWSYRSKSA